MQQSNQIIDAKNRGVIEGVIATTELYTKAYNLMLSNSNLDWAKVTVKREVIKNLTSIGMTLEDIKYWVNEYFLVEEDDKSIR